MRLWRNLKTVTIFFFFVKCMVVEIFTSQTYCLDNIILPTWGLMCIQIDIWLREKKNLILTFGFFFFLSDLCRFYLLLDVNISFNMSSGEWIDT